MPLRAAVTIAGLVIGLGALCLQLSISIPMRLSQGHDLLDALIWFFTYFTILTNIMLVLVYASDVWASARWLGWWRSAVTRGMMAAAMVLVMGFYHFVLAATWSPQGWFALADVLLHYVTPLIYLGWWLVFQPKGRLAFGDISWMALPPLAWLAWALLRGALVSEYPYPILEAHVLGYPQVAVNVLVMLIILLVLFAIVVALDRFLGRQAAT